MAAQELTLTVFGSEKAGRATLEEMMRRHERDIVRLCWRMLGNLDDAREAAQDVFLKVWTNLGQLEAGRDPAPWLYSIGMNVCRDRLRKRRPTIALESVDPAATGQSPEAELSVAEKMKMLAHALGRLPEKERAAIVLRDLEGYSTAEVARILGTSELTVRSQISTARVKLKEFTRRWLRSRK
jgi:RNA polymerase sigma-70 factor (ECF subfamily)